MGAIQSSINSMLSTTAVAVGGAKKIAADKATAAAANTEELIHIKEAQPKLEQDISAQENEVTDAMAAKAQTIQATQGELEQIAADEAAGTMTEEQAAQAETRKEQINADIEARTLALNTAQGKLDAMKMQRDYFTERIAKITGGKR